MLWRYTRHETKVLLVAVLLTFAGYGFLLAADWNFKQEVGFMGAQVVAVGAGVAENDVNRYMHALDVRERELNTREELLRGQAASSSDRTVLLLVSVFGAVLLALILMNFYLDSKRRLSIG